MLQLNCADYDVAALGHRCSVYRKRRRQGTSQQDKMQACNNMADKKGLKSDDRKNFMQSCLSKTADVQNPSEMSEKDKMNVCKNLADKRNLNAEDRRSFIKDCMKKANPK